jgi:hypothetical protein
MPVVSRASSSKAGRAAALRIRRLPTLREIARRCSDKAAQERLVGLLLLRRKLERLGRRRDYFVLARSMIDDPDNDCRWQAMVVVGEFCGSRPDLVWPVIRAYGGSRDEDMRMCVAVVLLEHVLEHHCAADRDRVRREARRQGRRFQETVRMCWGVGQAVDA